MSGSNRGNFIAIGIALLLAIFAGAWIYNDASALEQFYEHRAEQNAKAYRDTARIHAERACATLIGPKLFECVHDQYHAARQREHDEYDLQAQLVSATWTKAMGLAALIGMAVGILGVGLVYATFNATREANTIALAEADRSAKQAAAARKHIIQTERAILVLEKHNVVFDPDGKWINLSLTVRNDGKSNAWALQAFTAERRSRLFPSRFTGHPQMTFILNSGARANTTNIKLKASRHYPLWVFGYLAYTTAHEASFKNFFCVRLDGVPAYDAYGGQTINAPVDARHQVELPSDT
jgi:hypothetical protein